jgi:hypothetical protein
MRWQVAHSNERSSKPRFPGETRAKPVFADRTHRTIGEKLMHNSQLKLTSVSPLPDSSPIYKGTRGSPPH